MSIGTFTSTGRRLIAPVTVAATGLDTADIAQVAGVITAAVATGVAVTGVVAVTAADERLGAPVGRGRQPS
jgi:hypothetical protein